VSGGLGLPEPSQELLTGGAGRGKRGDRLQAFSLIGKSLYDVEALFEPGRIGIGITVAARNGVGINRHYSLQIVIHTEPPGTSGNRD
jgi:hypothetical protein